MLAVASACDGGGSAKQDAGVDGFVFPDAPDTPPTLTAFYPTPASVTPGVPTAITWAWNYLVDPPVPAPTCTIDNGVGTVTNGQMTMVTLNATTTYRLSCSNRAGMTARDTVISIPPAPPTLATFTATPSPLMPNAPTTVTFNWTYSTTPSPTPTCTIDGGIGAATQGMTASLTLPQARTYRLRCTSTQGSSFRDATVAVNECAGGTHDCNANATCTDTADSFTCACNAGYTGNGDVCSALANCGTTPTLCDPNATCVGTSSCVCNAGYIGSGTTCTRARLTFVTNSTGNGNISTTGGWTLAGTSTGLAAADAICQSEASTAGLLGTYVAWLSDGTSDAYCRVHNLPNTKKSAMCGLGALPVAAGPWLRTDAARTPAAPAIDRLLAPTRQTFNPVSFRANGTDTAGTSPQLIFTGTDDTGMLTGTACTDWTSSAGTGAMGDTLGGGTSWTDQGTDPSCSATGRLRCVEVGAGPALPSRHPVGAKRMFVTSVSGNGLLSTWPDAQGSTGITAADEICRTRARYAGYATATSFRAWASYSTISANSTSRFTYNGPWYRPDGVLVATSRTDLTDTRLASPIYLTETNTYLGGNAETGSVWTGALSSGSYYTSSYSCSSWQTSSGNGIYGRHDLADFRWSNQGTVSTPTTALCSAPDYRLYCLEDTP
ncbi:MAG TPA: calcium-binding EGF-like domain-containing protein [Kofleriaceae bacterium]